MSVVDQRNLGVSVFECYLFYRSGNPTIYALTTTNKEVTLTVVNDSTQEEDTIIFYPAQLQRSEIKRSSDENADEMRLTSTFTEPFLTQITNAAYQGLNVKLYTVYAQTTKNTYTQEDYEVSFWGFSDDISLNDNTVSINFLSNRDKLKNEIPRYVFQRSCNHNLYDTFTCKVDKEQFKIERDLLEISVSRAAIKVGYINKDSQWFAGGLVQFSDGSQMTINDDSVNAVENTRVLTLVGQVGDQITLPSTVKLYPGCDRSITTCRTKFNNTTNFGGFPYIRIKSLSGDYLG